MAIKSLKSGSYGRSVMAGNSLILPGDYESIATATVGAGGASSVTFSSIPSTFTHLQIRHIARNGTPTGDDIAVLARFNDDSTYTNYFGRHLLYGNGTEASAVAQNTSGWTGAYIGGASKNVEANTHYVNVTDILDYKNSNKNKVVRTLGGGDFNGSGTVFLSSSLWLNTSAITKITLVPYTNTFAQYSHFALYGIRG